VVEAARIDPDALDAEAEKLTAEAEEAIRTPPALFLEAAQKRALAEAERKRLQAVEGVRLTSLAVSLAEERYDALEEPEKHAASRAFDALQALQRIHAARQKALDEDAPVDEINRLGVEATAAAGTSQELDAKVEAAVAARAKAYADLEQCRRVRQQARALLEQAEAAVANPSIGDLPLETVRQALRYCFPYRILQAKAGEGPLTRTEEIACEGLAAGFADAMDVIPAGAEAKVIARMREAAAKELHGKNIAVGNGRVVNLGQALALPGGAGR